MNKTPKASNFSARMIGTFLGVFAGGTVLVYAAVTLARRWGWTNASPDFALWWGGGFTAYFLGFLGWLWWGEKRRKHGSGAWLPGLHIGTTGLSDYYSFHTLIVPLALAVVKCFHPQGMYTVLVQVGLLFSEIGFMSREEGRFGSSMTRIIAAVIAIVFVIDGGVVFQPLFPSLHSLQPDPRARLFMAMFAAGCVVCVAITEWFSRDALRFPPPLDNPSANDEQGGMA